jgi:two-component system, LytTR family, response regulator
MIKVLIIDDEPSAVSTLSLLLNRYAPELDDIRNVNDASEGLKLLDAFKPQVVFLDIQMPRMNGFEFLRKAGAVNFDVIFTTAYDQYAIQAIRYSALDYLLKPIDASELRAAVNRFLSRQAGRNSQPQLNNLLLNVMTPPENFKLAVSTTEGMFFFAVDEIVHLEAEGSYTRLNFVNRKSLVASRVLKDFEELLSHRGFIRTHKSHMVNMKFIRSIHPDGFLELTNQSKVEISRRRKTEIQRILMSGK